MKQIIGGLTYNTETADCIGRASLDDSSDFRWWSAGLYRTKKGRFFLAGRGNGLSRFAQSCGNQGSCAGSGIEPMDMEEAREWAERYLTTAEVEEGFAEHIQDA
jgi:hypothetical protein